jgi:hypothetical protein
MFRSLVSCYNGLPGSQVPLTNVAFGPNLLDVTRSIYLYFTSYVHTNRTGVVFTIYLEGKWLIKSKHIFRGGGGHRKNI